MTSPEVSDGAAASASARAGLTNWSFTSMIDLSVGIIEGALHEPNKPTIKRTRHEVEGLEWMLKKFSARPEDLTLSGGLGPAFETVTTSVHCGTHVDAPWHYGPVSEGRPAKTIDECPLEWFFGDGVVLDLRHKQAGEKISQADVEGALSRIDYTLKPLDLVMIMTGGDERLGSEEYFDQPGMTRESTLWLVEQGIKVIGVDTYGFDRKFEDMRDDFLESGDGSAIWPAHFAGIEREYCQIEKLVNLTEIPRPTGFKVAAFPVKVEGASGGWCRPVAFV